MSNFSLAWTWLGCLLVLDLVVPWVALRHVQQLEGAFLFWTVWAAVAIASGFVIFLRWRGTE
jgi:hypothetical protein